MPRPSTLTFNELNGEEVREVLASRFEQIMGEVPYFQRHITLPRVRMTLSVKLELWSDQPKPEELRLGDTLTVIYDGEPAPSETIEAESVDAAAPIPGGHPPDEIREMHNIPVSQPGPGPRNIGAHIVTSDAQAQLDGREVQGLPGLKVSRTGSGVIDGMPTSANATVAKIDQGPAGLRSGIMNRDRWNFGSKR